MNVSIEVFKEIIEEEIKILPDQSPLEHFVHHNNLHNFEDKKFEVAVEDIYLKYGKSPYMKLKFYRDKLKSNEISETLFRKCLELNGFIGFSDDLIRFIMQSLHSFEDINEIKFLLSEGVIFDLKTKKRRDMNSEEKLVWEKVSEIKCSETILEYPDFHINRSVERVNKILIPYLSIMLDQGQAAEYLPDKDRDDFWNTFIQYLKPLVTKEQLSKAQSLSGKDSIQAIFDNYLSGFKDKDELQGFLRGHLQSLPGWAGLVHKVSKNKEIIPRKDVSLNIYRYLLCRLFLSSEINKNRVTSFIPITSALQTKINVFYFFTQNITDYGQEEILKFFENLNPLVLRRIFQQSFEETFNLKILNGFFKQPQIKKTETKYQIFFCLDDREESLRRHLEEVAPNIETYGVAGFFGFDIMYKKVNEPRARRLCPPAAKPKFLVEERGSARTFKYAHLLHENHSGFISTTIQSILFSPVKAFDSNLHLFLPREKRKFSNILQETVITEIDYQNEKFGYSDDEVARRVAGILTGAGLTEDFAPYIVMIGHGHNSFNNPHVAAYRCGACSGGNAAPNARIFAKAANNIKIRTILKESYNLDIPETSHFLGGFHDTCNDDIQIFDNDNDKMSNSEQRIFNEILLEARRRNAKERCRKFYQVSDTLTKEESLRHVEERAWRVAEPRPELNHATDTLCVVGKRDLTRNVFLDRKSFLVSYNYEKDKTGEILAGLLSAVVPVCEGINLEYYFSKVDTENYGSGSKTSHNVTGLIGVANGVRGDLRTGLVWQMVEYHNPLRMLFIIESTPEAMQKIMDNNKQVHNMIKNNWIYVALINPKDPMDIKLYRDGEYKSIIPLNEKIKSFASSVDVPTSLFDPVDIAYIGGEGDA